MNSTYSSLLILIALSMILSIAKAGIEPDSCPKECKVVKCCLNGLWKVCPSIDNKDKCAYIEENYARKGYFYCREEN